jgi:hypothetical protein
MIKHLKENE